MQKPQSLGYHLLDENIDACRVAAWPGEAGDKTMPDRVFTRAEDDRDGRCCSFGRERDRGDRRDDHGHLSADQIGHQCRRSVILTLEPVVFDGHVLAFDVAAFHEAFAERGRTARGGIERPAIDKSNDRHRRLLCARREWARGRRAAEQRDEVAPLHSITSSARASNIGGTSSGSALAVLRLITSSNVVGWRTGRSAGRAPLRICAAYAPY